MRIARYCHSYISSYLPNLKTFKTYSRQNEDVNISGKGRRGGEERKQVDFEVGGRKGMKILLERRSPTTSFRDITL